MDDSGSTVRHDLARRVAAATRACGTAGAGDLALELGAIRTIAYRHGLAPVSVVASALAAALARGERGPIVQGWLALLADAVGCERTDARACETYAAACSVRLAG